MTYQDHGRILDHYFFLSYLLVLALCTQYLRSVSWETPLAITFSLAVYLTYGLLYLLPALFSTRLIRRLSHLVSGEDGASRTTVAITYLLAILTTAATDVLLLADIRIHDIYGFHINGFVINLVITPGGLDSLGGGTATTVAFAGVALALTGICGLLLWLARGFYRRHLRGRERRRSYRYLVVVFLALSVSERVGYGASNLRGYTPVLTAAGAFPLYLPLTFRGLAKRLGIQAVRDDRVRLKAKIGALHYPLHPLHIDPPRQPYNLVWLVSESLRADMLDPEIMPATWRFAQQAHRYTRHYSGSNSTRMGVFSQFYGLYGAYWFAFLAARQGPVLFEVLRRQGYQWRFFTSQKFTYPEFDQTVFAEIPRSAMQSYTRGPGWQRDRKNVNDLLGFVRAADPDRPFMAYMFFESPHARYYFPEDSVIRRPYLAELNYATMSLAEDMPLIRNRYVNSVHHLDTQLERVYDELRSRDLMDRTIVLVTGDHGEEFMENGRWGHGSSFSEGQTRTPLVLWIPDTGHSVEDRMSSHIDIIPTLLPRLGVRNPPGDYSLGLDLLGPERHRYVITGHWNTLGYIDADYKATFSLHGAALESHPVTTHDDRPVSDASVFYRSRRRVLAKVMAELARFGRRR